MIYLDNTQQQQECWIPRQDILSGHSGGGGGGSYQEGYNDGVAHQKSLLATTAFTQNGEYTRSNGWSGISVNVPQTGSTARLEEKTVVISADTTNVHPSIGFDGMSAVTVDAEAYAQQNYDSGFDDGFDDGYSSGSTDGYESGYTSGHTDGVNDQKTLLSTTAFTENGEYSREDGWSGISVNVDTASTYNSGYTNGYESGYTTGYTSGHTDGVSEEKAKMSAVTFTANTAVTLSDGSYSAVTVDVPQTGYTQQDLDNAFASGETVGENAIISTFSSMTATTNGEYGSSAHPLSAITVDVPTGTSIPLSSITITANTAVTVVDKAYTGITVNVQQSSDIEPNKSFTATSNGNYTIHPSTALTVVDGDGSDDTYYWFTATTSGYPLSGVYEILQIEDTYDASIGYIQILVDNGRYRYDLTNWNGGGIVDFYGSVNGTLNFKIKRLIVEMGVVSTPKYVYGSDSQIVFDAMSEVSLNVNVDTASTYNSGYTAGYVSGNTDGFNYGYESGENAIISTFSSMTATTNGVYGSSAHPLSSITVDVPQTSKTVKYIEYIETDGSEIIWDTGVNIQSSDVKIYLDFMWLTGSTAEYTPFISQVYNDDYFSYYFSVDGNPLWSSQALQRIGSDATVVPMNKDVKYFSVASNTGITLNGTAYANTFTSFDQTNEHMYLNARIYYGNIWRANSARYYRFAVETSGGTMLADLRPCLDDNDIPCFYDEVSQTYIYHNGSGTPISGPVIPTEDYVSGHTQGMKDALEDSFYGAYYPVDSATSGSYYTVFPTLEDGQKLYFDIVVYTAQNSSLLGNNQGNLYLSMSTSDGVNLRVADSNGLSGATLHSYWLEYYRPNQNPYSRNISRVCGEVSVTSGECKTALDTGGAWLQEIATSGDFSLQYPVTFNTSCASGLVLNSLVYKDVQTNETIHHYKLNPDTLEMEDYFNDNTVAPTYDKNGNLVSGVLEPRQFRF